MLEAAHGLVRCGVCLSVFEANENYINSLPLASNDELGSAEDNSVFISGQEDYFSPATFLQRSELLDDDEEHQSDEATSEELANDDSILSEDSDVDDVWTIVDLTVEQWDSKLEEDYAYDETEFGRPGEETFIELPDADLPDIELSDANLADVNLVDVEKHEDADVISAEEGSEAARILSQQEVDPTTFLVPTDDETEFELEEALDSQPYDPSNDSENDPYRDHRLNPLYDDLAFFRDDTDWSTSETGPNLDEKNHANTGGVVSTKPGEPTTDQEPAPETKEEFRARLESSELQDNDGEFESLSQENLAAISSVDSSLELEQARPLGQIKRTLGLSLLSLLLLFVLAGQFFWLRMPILSLDSEFRPGYEFACRLFNCELPPIQDLINIQTENLVIRSHPEYANSLVLTAVFRNVADYQQPFPVIELSFSDLDSQPIASREFYPVEYLAPELHAITNMAVGAPVQITVELVDPGETAVNYHLNYKPFPASF